MTDSRVLQMSPFASLSGPNRSMLALVAELARRGPTFVFLLREDEVAAEARRLGATVEVAFPGGLPKRRVKRFACVVAALRRAIRRHDIEAMHVHTAAGSRYAWPAARLTGAKLLIHQRDMYAPNYFHLGLGRADRIVAVSRWVAQTLPERWRDRTTVIYNPIDVPALPAEESTRPRRLRVGMAAVCLEFKGHFLLIDAALSLMDRLDFEVHLWGLQYEGPSGPYGRRIRQRCESSRHADRFILQPFRQDTDEFFRGMDIVVMPSLVREGFGRVAAEAMAWRRPVLVAGHGGLLEIVDHERTGLTFAPGDAEALAQRLERLLTDAPLRHRLAQAGRAKVETEFSSAAHADAVTGVYHRLLDRARSA